MRFYNREEEIRKTKAVLSDEPNLVYFVYGPINSGKTALLMKVFEELSEDYRVFYINFRGFEGGYTKFTRVFFKFGDKNLWEKIKSNMPILSAAVEYIERLAKKVNTAIELPAKVIRMLQVGEEDPEKIDMFYYLEEVMRRFNERGKKPVFVLDEMQVLKGEFNAIGQPLLARLFNFMVRLTKETHLCHCLCATSDCLFIEDIYNNAKLEGRAEYLLVDDLDKEKALEVYEKFGFKKRELIWDYIGGKLGDMIKLYEKKKIGLREEEALIEMLKNVKAKLSDILERIEYGEKSFEYEKKIIRIEKEKVIKILQVFKSREEVRKEELMPIYRNYLVSENVLFYNPVEGTIRPQGKLVARAIKEIL